MKRLLSLAMLLCAAVTLTEVERCPCSGKPKRDELATQVNADAERDKCCCSTCNTCNKPTNTCCGCNRQLEELDTQKHCCCNNNSNTCGCCKKQLNAENAADRCNCKPKPGRRDVQTQINADADKDKCCCSTCNTCNKPSNTCCGCNRVLESLDTQKHCCCNTTTTSTCCGCQKRTAKVAVGNTMRKVK